MHQAPRRRAGGLARSAPKAPGFARIQAPYRIAAGCRGQTAFPSQKTTQTQIPAWSWQHLAAARLVRVQWDQFFECGLSSYNYFGDDEGILSAKLFKPPASRCVDVLCAQRTPKIHNSNDAFCRGVRQLEFCLFSKRQTRSRAVTGIRVLRNEAGRQLSCPACPNPFMERGISLPIQTAAVTKCRQIRGHTTRAARCSTGSNTSLLRVARQVLVVRPIGRGKVVGRRTREELVNFRRKGDAERAFGGSGWLFS